MSALNTLEIAGVKFAEGTCNARQYGAVAKYTGRDNGPCEISFNADMLEKFPVLAAAERVRVFVAAGPKPIVAVFPAEAGEGVRLIDNGSSQQRPRKVIKGTILRALSAYRHIEYRVEQITTPRLGWQLVPVTSEKKA